MFETTLSTRIFAGALIGGEFPGSGFGGRVPPGHIYGMGASRPSGAWDAGHRTEADSSVPISHKAVVRGDQSLASSASSTTGAPVRIRNAKEGGAWKSLGWIAL